MTDWPNRIVRYGTMPADQFLANPANPRRHPNAQREALRGSFDALGIIAPVLINSRTGFMIDGHARIEECLTKDDQMLVPFIEVDLSEDEEALALASFDWITQMATYDRDALDGLLRDVSTDNAALQLMLSDLAESQGVIGAIDPRDEWMGMPEFEQESLKHFHEIRIVFLKEADMSAFSALVGQTITEKTTSIFYPKKPKREIGVYQEGDDES
jgi:hypothetical protein